MIESHVPIPEAAYIKRKYNAKYPWRKCKNVGDSFYVQEETDKVVSAMIKFCQRNKEFRFYAEPDNLGKLGVRVWRIENEPRN